ncbi:MAG: hypothetical protein KY459_14495 [Acidobacteria bacterium]|nr:hypothetical protein [Acidobacteriota bacterium]
MAFPPHIEQVLIAYGLRPDTKASLYELYEHLGNPALDVFADLAEGVTRMDEIAPEDLQPIHREVVERYVARSHARWSEGMPTPSFWHSRELEGRAAGLVTPIGVLGKDADTVLRRRLIGACEQSIPSVVLLMSQNAHFGGRIGSISFDVVPRDAGQAKAVAISEGRQHTIPGSVGETSGSWDPAGAVALIWEVQPNVLKPEGGRNAGISKVWRSLREWHLITLVSALQWLTDRKTEVYFVAADALAITHQVNPKAVLSETIAGHYQRTVDRALAAFDSRLEAASETEVRRLVELDLPNKALSDYLETETGGVVRMTRHDA